MGRSGQMGLLLLVWSCRYIPAPEIEADDIRSWFISLKFSKEGLLGSRSMRKLINARPWPEILGVENAVEGSGLGVAEDEACLPIL